MNPSDENETSVGTDTRDSGQAQDGRSQQYQSDHTPDAAGDGAIHDDARGGVAGFKIDPFSASNIYFDPNLTFLAVDLPGTSKQWENKAPDGLRIGNLIPGNTLRCSTPAISTWSFGMAGASNGFGAAISIGVTKQGTGFSASLNVLFGPAVGEALAASSLAGGMTSSGPVTEKVVGVLAPQMVVITPEVTSSISFDNGKTSGFELSGGGIGAGVIAGISGTMAFPLTLDAQVPCGSVGK